MAHLDFCEGDATSMKEFLGVFLAMMDERRHEVMLAVVTLICAAAVWTMLLVWTQ